MRESEKLKYFLAEYKDYISNVLQPTRNEIKNLLDHWRKPGHWRKYSNKSRLPAPSLVQRVFSRIKRPESVVDKILRKPTEFPDGPSPSSFRQMNDAIGARVILYFMSQLPIIDRELQGHKELEISQKHSPVAYLSEDLTKRLGLNHLNRQDKESGYASIHYIIRLRNSVVPKKDRPWIELQIRTLAEDLWSEVEHILGYKPNKRTSFAVKKQFQILGTQLTAIDEHFNFLYEELLRFQEEVTFRDIDPLNAENLPSVLSEIGIGCSQQEVDGLLKLLASRSIGTVQDLRQFSTTKRLETIRNTYRSVLGREPINFEIVANLATLVGAVDEEEELNLIKTQISYLESWDVLKKSFKK